MLFYTIHFDGADITVNMALKLQGNAAFILSHSTWFSLVVFFKVVPGQQLSLLAAPGTVHQ